jgi:hypothetical protein
MAAGPHRDVPDNIVTGHGVCSRGRWEAMGLAMSEKSQLLDELHAVVTRARGVQAALTGCVELGSDRGVIEGVLAVFLDNMDALTDFQHKLKTFLGRP